MTVDAVIVAAGQSRRMSANKLLYELGASPLIVRTALTFLSVKEIDRIIIVTSDENIIAQLSFDEKFVFVAGGATRTLSVAAALNISVADIVLVHDGARPFVSASLIRKVIESTVKYGSAVPILPLSDSIRKKESDTLTNFPDRENFCLAQTPQGFDGEKLRRAYADIGKESFTDDSQLFAKFFTVHTIEGEESNKKITFDNDLLGINARVGNGFDLHRLEEGLPLTLGGVVIPFDKGLVAHSDGDALVHSIMDALLSAAGERDIGCQFPDTDKQYKGISSLILLGKVAEILAQKNIKINNISSVILAEKPKLAGYIPGMADNIANALKIKSSSVSISATTTERTGIIGKGEAIAAYTVCSCC
ncbi:MAG: 2-C-methyl-D-erythritol 2,4-cyclodiphosphate synthase [Clostridia bacterium]|nr:2-C-methyl-D-erythritol 2,4-cyclodiphosphate synthase [Clostridia bacterium]